MGQFEIMGSKTIKIEPDIIKIVARIEVSKKETADVDTAKEELKQKVAKLASDIKKVSDVDCSFSDMWYSKSEALFAQPKGFGGKKAIKQYDVTGSTEISIKLTSKNEEVLKEILGLLIDNASVKYINSHADVSNIDSYRSDLKRDVCKSCREDAEVITAGLGSEILGVDKIVYNSSGSLLNNESHSKTVFSPSSTLFEDDDCCYGSSDDFDDDIFADSTSVNTVDYNQVWVDGFVKTILDEMYTLSDSVTVVFNVK